LGFKQLTSVTWFSLSGPAGMSPALMSRINAEVRRIMHTASVQEQLAKDSMETFDWDVTKFNQFFVSEVKRWGPLAAGLKGED